MQVVPPESSKHFNNFCDGRLLIFLMIDIMTGKESVPSSETLDVFGVGM